VLVLDFAGEGERRYCRAHARETINTVVDSQLMC
jgi:hypothetical protein